MIAEGKLLEIHGTRRGRGQRRKIGDQKPLLDLCYVEECRAEVDLNLS